MAFNPKALVNAYTFRHEALTLLEQISTGQGGNGGGPSATDALLTDIKDGIAAILPLIDGLELITGNIKIDTAAVNLDVDEVEAKLDTLADSLATLNSMAAAEGADIALIRPAAQNALASLELIRTGTASDLAGVQSLLNDLLIKLNQVYGSTSTIESVLNVLEQRSRPLVWTKTNIVDVGDAYSPGSFDLGDDLARRAVRITNNSGDAKGRQAATAFIAYNGEVPDIISFVQVCVPGESILLDSPQAPFAIRFAGISTIGTISVVEYQ